MKRFSLDGPFNLSRTLSCGQTFRWRCVDDIWSAPVGNSLWKVQQKGSVLWYEGCSEDALVRYFDLELNLDGVLSSIDTDPLMHQVISAAMGLRICRQPAFECLISYICASCSNIPIIAKRIELLSEKYGKRISDGVYAFPQAQTLAESSPEEIRGCKTGYRDRAVYEAAVYAVEHRNRISALPNMSYEDAKTELMTLCGVGPKVADCALLFGFGFYEAFPIDVWIDRILRMQYFADTCGKKLAYEKASSFARQKFGRYAGYAQEYLYAERDRVAAYRM